MKMAYGTYAMPMLSLDKAIQSVADIGYDGIELAIGPSHNSMPDKWDSTRRKRVKNLLIDLDLGVPALFILKNIYTEDVTQHKANLKLTQQVIELAKKMDLGRETVVSLMLGGQTELWETQRKRFVRLLKDYEKLAADERTILAFEPHCHAAVDRIDRAVWLMKAIDNPLVRLHFDIVHFFLARENIDDAVTRLVPLTAHTHLADARFNDGGFEFTLLRKGQLDCSAYIKAMYEAGWESYITVEVSRMIWGKEGYDPIWAARFSYNCLCKAFKEAGVPCR